MKSKDLLYSELALPHTDLLLAYPIEISTLTLQYLWRE